METERRNSRLFKLCVTRSGASIARKPAKENSHIPIPVNKENLFRSIARVDQSRAKENVVPGKQRKGSQDSGRKPLSNFNNADQKWRRLLSFGGSSGKAGSDKEKDCKSSSSSDSDCFVDASDDSFSAGIASKSRAKNLKQIEERILYSEAYLKDSAEFHLQSFTSRGVEMDAHIPKDLQKIRCTVVDWIFAVQCYYRLPDMVSHIAIQILDLVLQTMEVEEKDIQVVGGAALWLAAKLDYNRIMSAKQMKKVIGKSCTMERLKSAEEVVFKVLNYCIPRDSALSVLNYQLHVLKTEIKVDEELRMIGLYVLEHGLHIWSLSVRSYGFLASMSTMCAVLLSGQNLQDKVWVARANTDVTFLPLSEAKRASIFMLRKLVDVQRLRRASGHLWAKFSTDEKLHIALNPKLSAENIQRILKRVFQVEKV